VNYSSRIYVAGHRGLAGSAIVRALQQQNYHNLIFRTRAELDLRDSRAVDAFFAAEAPEFVFVAAAKVGGILANSTYPVEFLKDNLAIQNNVIDAAYRFKASKLLFLGSSCIYPKLAPQPLKEEYILTGPLEPTNEWYAIGKIAGIKLCEAYRQQYGFNAISLMPTNLYGPGDNFDLQTSHVLPALIRKFHDAKTSSKKEIILWGSGSPRREFLHVDDFASATLFLMQNYNEKQFINVGTGEDLTISDLAALVARVVGFEGKITYDPTKPDGTPRKLMDISRLKSMGWTPTIALEDGIRSTYDWFTGKKLLVDYSTVGSPHNTPTAV
jgi:GDP-L-fucose synthase